MVALIASSRRLWSREWCSNRSMRLRKARSLVGFSIVELLMASGVFMVLAAALFSAFSMVNRSMALAQGYALGKLTLSDYLSMDLRRSQIDLSRCGIANPTTAQSFGLPLALIQDEYFTTNNRTPREPVRVTLTNGQLKKDKAKIVSSSYAFSYRYDATKGFLPRYVTYYQSGNSIFRKEEGYNTATPPALYTISDRRIETGIQSISFSSGDIVVGSAPSSNFLTEVKFQVNFVPNFFTRASTNPVGSPGQAVLFNQVYIRSVSYGSPLPPHP